MNLMDRARKDAQKIITGIFSEKIMLLTKNLSKFEVLKGTHSKHWLKITTDGSVLNSKNAHITISESDVVDLGFQIRGSNGDISMRGFFCVAKDSSGFWSKYQISEVYPNQTLGIIVCILKDAEFNVSQEQWDILN